METSSDLHETFVVDSDGETETVVSPDESPPMNAPMDTEEFNRRVQNLTEMMKDNPDVMLRCIAEIYVNMASAEMGIRGVVETIQQGGMAGLMKGAFGRGK